MRSCTHILPHYHLYLFSGNRLLLPLHSHTLPYLILIASTSTPPRTHFAFCYHYQQRATGSNIPALCRRARRGAPRGGGAGDTAGVCLQPQPGVARRGARAWKARIHHLDKRFVGVGEKGSFYNVNGNLLLLISMGQVDLCGQAAFTRAGPRIPSSMLSSSIARVRRRPHLNNNI